ncbi:hypothetical protein EC988_007280, partial [Linderina pennispora]
EDNKMIIKPLNKREQQFYEGTSGEFKSFMPEYYGTLHRTSTDGGAAGEMYVCMENVTSGFARACVMDVKVGTRLHDDDATEEKKQRMEKKAQQTTTASLGVRICGMAVAGRAPADRDWCRGLTDQTIGDAFKEFFAAAGEVSEEFRRYIVRQFVLELQDYLRVVEGMEARMYASSLLFVYEADAERYQRFLADDGVDGMLDLRAIDFAHSRWTPGQGSDACYLVGLHKLIDL